MDLSFLSSSRILDFLSSHFYTVCLVIFVLLSTIIVQKIFAQLLKDYFSKSSKFIKVDPTQYSFLRHFISAIIYIIGIGTVVYVIPSLRSLSISIFAGAGILAVIVGFASQQAFSNIVSGIFIVIFKPFRVNDRIKVGNDVAGIVEDITLRHTVIRTYENKHVIIPNSVISNEKIENANFGDERICKILNFGIGYDADIDLAMHIIRDEAMNHPNMLDNRTADELVNNIDPVIVRVIGWGDSSINLRAWVWAKDISSAFVLGCDLYKSVKERFDEAGIEIPYPYRTVIMKKPSKSKKVKTKKYSFSQSNVRGIDYYD